MQKRRASEIYILGVLGVLTALLGFATVVAGAIVISWLPGYVSGDRALDALDILAGVLMVAVCAGLSFGAYRLYRVIERRGAVHPPS